jgi:octaprenyl-diphosphate synthase
MAPRSLAAHDLVRDELDQMQATLEQLASSDVALLAQACQHVLDGGGKRIRPTLLALSARAAGGDDYRPDPQCVLLAAAVETVHVASLLHDDVVDGASMRRGRVSVNAEWGSSISIFTADYLFSGVFRVLATPDNVELLRPLATAVMRMCEAEVLQASSMGDVDVSEDDYRQIIQGKTAALMSTACRIGGMLAPADDAAVDALAAYGRDFGMAFQITDDMLDLAGSPHEVGKTLGSDVRAGYFTLPIIALRDRVGDDARQELRAIMGRGEVLTPDDITFVASQARTHGALEYASGVASEYVEQALTHLHALPRTEARMALEDLAKSLLGRRS